MLSARSLRFLHALRVMAGGTGLGALTGVGWRRGQGAALPLVGHRHLAAARRAGVAVGLRPGRGECCRCVKRHGLCLDGERVAGIHSTVVYGSTVAEPPALEALARAAVCATLPPGRWNRSAPTSPSSPHTGSTTSMQLQSLQGRTRCGDAQMQDTVRASGSLEFRPRCG